MQSYDNVKGCRRNAGTQNIPLFQTVWVGPTPEAERAGVCTLVLQPCQLVPHLPSTGNDLPLTARLAAALLMTFHVQLTTEQLVS